MIDPLLVREAALRLAGIARRTPLRRSRALEALTGVETWLKLENEQLVGNYQFSARSIEGYTSTVDLLGLLCRAVTDRSENRFIFEATYGKGKSHFALALANFFGKAETAPETRTILETIGHVSSDSRVGGFKDFKTHYKPFMTVLIDGVGPGSLRDKFFRAFDEALKDNEVTADVTPPFWFEKALTYLDNIKPEDRPRADAFLEPSRLDVSLLRDSYVDLPDAAVDDLIDYFFALTRGTAASPAAGLEFRRRFELMALQRNLKALGTFGYQTTTRGNPVYMQYVPRTLAYVGRTLTREPRYGRLAALLGGLVEELRYNSRQL